MKKFKVNGKIIEANTILDAISKCKDETLYMIIDKDEGKYIYNVDLSNARYLTTNSAEKADKFNLNEANRIINELKKYNLSNYTTSEYFGDSCKDSDLEKLSQEEEDAVDSYRKAIEGTNSLKLIELYKHILEEEEEHLRELQEAEVNDSKKKI